MSGWSSVLSDTEIGSANASIMAVKPHFSKAPTPGRASSRLRLSSIADCKREIAKLYREVRRGELASAEAGKLVWMLNVLANLIADHDLESRIAELERRE
jgi:hypothetical protein